MNEEILGIEKNDTWELVDLPKDKTNNGVKWVYKNKLVTSSSHIYPSNRPTRVNMQEEANIKGFNLLIQLKEVKSMERHHTSLPHQQKKLPRAIPMTQVTSP